MSPEVYKIATECVCVCVRESVCVRDVAYPAYDGEN
jgi:hypothetical protein